MGSLGLFSPLSLSPVLEEKWLSKHGADNPVCFGAREQFWSSELRYVPGSLEFRRLANRHQLRQSVDFLGKHFLFLLDFFWSAFRGFSLPLEARADRQR